MAIESVLWSVVLFLYSATAKESVSFDSDRQSLRYEAPDDCQWWIREPAVSGNDEVSLTCMLRTINSEFDTTNFSVIPSEHTTSLRIECNNEILSKSSIDDKSFMHLAKLRELELEHCKLGRWPADTLVGLKDLKNLTVRTHNREWAAMSLEFAADSFVPVKQLQILDLSTNNIWSFPEQIFCPLTNLILLNVSENRLQDINDLGYKEKGHKKSLLTGSSNDPKHHFCSTNVQIFDASFNNFVVLPAHSFFVIKRIKELYLQNNEISMIADKALAGLKELQIVDFSNNKIVALPAELFKDCLSSIKEIYLQNNSISVLSPGLFSNLEQLLALDLSRNLLTSSWITSDTFSGLIRLVLLNLSANKISTLEASFFRDLYTLQILNLGYNQIETISAETFSPMSNLHTLLLSFNKLSYLDAYSLNGLYVLSQLTLDNNRLEDIHPESLRNCSSLQDLNLNGNSLNAVPLALKHMRLLKTVDLGENNISSLDDPGFRGMYNLYGLRIIGNRIRNISKFTFMDLPALQILNIARNEIESVEPGAFETNSNLQAVRLDSNLLTDIKGLFSDVPSLLWLNISDNQLEWFDYAMIPRGLQWLDIHKNNLKELGNHYGLKHEISLQTLDASFNQLTRISAASFPASIELLFLNDNLISLVEPHTFYKNTNLTRVDLYANQIASMDLNALRLSAIPENKPLPEFYIGGNPFQCDCTMEWLQRINGLDDSRQHPRVMDLGSVYCKLLHNRESNYIPLVEADSSQFLCTYKTHCFALCHCCDFDACDCEMTCPTNCTCYHDQSWSTNIVECTAGGYVHMPSRIPMDATEVYLDGNNFGELFSHSFIGRKNLKVLYANNSNIAAIYNHTFSGLRRLTILHLENNRIKQLLGFELATLESLRELYLQENTIYYVDNRTFLELKHLQVLRLEGNLLSFFEVWRFSANPYLVDIGLAGNEWSCNCLYVEKFRSWLQVNYAKVTDANKIMCMYNNITKELGPHLADFNATLCSIYSGNSRAIVETQVMNDYLPLLLVAMCVFLVSVVIVCGAFYYRRELRVWIYSRCGLRMCYKTTAFEEQQEKDRLFDAYVSYSVKDEPFVSQVLAPGLEGGDPGYRLCLHYRDFNVSAYVTDTIIEAVESSRRTIIVLSKNFLHNEWCRFEFKSALHEVLKDKKRRMIFIVTGELPQCDLDPDLRVYLNSKMSTVVHWGDRHFWQKVQLSMPNVRCIHQRSSANIYSSSSASIAVERSRSVNTMPLPNPKVPPFIHQHSLSRDGITTSHSLIA